MTNESRIFKKNREDYLERISSLDLSSAAGILGLRSEDHCFVLPFFHRKLIILDDNIVVGNGGELIYNELVIVSKYLSLCPKTQHHDTDWVSFKDFKRTSYFLNVNIFAKG